MTGKETGDKDRGFAFRVKFGEYEVEINGTREDVLKTVGELPGLMPNVSKAFDTLKPKTVTTLTVKTEPTKQEALSQKYPKISAVGGMDEAVLRLLETDWGKWRPRTLDELREAMKANGLESSGRVLSGILMGLVRKSKVRRWNTDAGYVYILAEKETVGSGSDSNE